VTLPDPETGSASSACLDCACATLSSPATHSLAHVWCSIKTRLVRLVSDPSPPAPFCFLLLQVLLKNLQAMATCAICLDALKSPTAYPCGKSTPASARFLSSSSIVSNHCTHRLGHVFCYECVTRTIKLLSPLATTSCPTCRAAFPIG
jgi:hypothetical protein